MCFSPCLIPLLQLCTPLILCAFKILLFGALAFLFSVVSSPFAPPPLPRPKPKVAFCVSNNFLSFATVLPRCFDRPDVATLNLFGVALFGGSFTQFRIFNLYNLWSQRSRVRTVPPDLSFPDDGFALLVVGDFNIHHPLADPLRAYSCRYLAASFPYFSRAADLGFELLNLPGVFTRFPWDSATRPFVIDLLFASPVLFPFFRSWGTPLPSTGSDHVPISLTFAHPISSPSPPVPNWCLTDWNNLSPVLNDSLIPPPPSFPTSASLEAWFDTQLALVTTLLSSHTPLKRPSPRSKPWWSPILLVLRLEFHSASRRSGSSASASAYDKAAARLSKQGYFKAIKATKKAHRKSLLNSTTSHSILAVKKIAAGSPNPRFPNLPDASSSKEMNQVLLDHLFPPRPCAPLPSILLPYGDCPELPKEDVSLSLLKCLPSLAPGPDSIPYWVWKSVHHVSPGLLVSLLAPLLPFGHHPSSLKKANGVVLDKPGLQSYDSSSSFRIIVLLQTVSKILEKIVTTSLAPITRHTGLLHPNQCGSLPSLSSFDACSAQTDTVRTLQRPCRQVSSLFLDISGGFDNADATILCSDLRCKGVNHYLVAWVRSFLSDRSCRLLFQGSPRILSPVSIGTPPGLASLSHAVRYLRLTPRHAGSKRSGSLVRG